MSRVEWNAAQRITLGVDADMCRRIMEEWFHRQAPVAMTVRKAKTPGLYAVVIDVDAAKEVRGVHFALWCIDMDKDIKVDIKGL